MPVNVTPIYSYVQIAVLAALPVAGAVVLAWSLVALYFDLRNHEQQRLRARLIGKVALARKKVLPAGLLRQVRESASTGPGRRALAAALGDRLQTSLEQAGLTWSASKFLMMTAGGTVVAVLAAGLLFRHRLLMVLPAALIGLALPPYLVHLRRKIRMKRMIEQLPEVFELISQALKAGHSLSSGIQVVGEQMMDPAGTEFTRVFYEQNLGIKIEDALAKMGDRLGLLDVKMFVTAVLVQRQSGGNLTEVMDNIGSVIRDRLEVLGQTRALTAEGRLSGWVLCLLPVVVLCVVLVLNPDYGGVLVSEPRGRLMLGVGGTLQVVGMLMIRKIVNIKI